MNSLDKISQPNSEKEVLKLMTQFLERDIYLVTTNRGKSIKATLPYHTRVPLKLIEDDQKIFLFYEM